MLEKTLYKALEDWKSDEQLLNRMRLATTNESRVREMAVKSILWEIFKQHEVSLEECFITAQQKVAWHIGQLENNLSLGKDI